MDVNPGVSPILPSSTSSTSTESAGEPRIRAALTCGDAEEAFKWKGLEAAGMRSWLPNEEIESPNGKMHISRGGPLLHLGDRVVAAYSVPDRRPGAAAERSSGRADYHLRP